MSFILPSSQNFAQIPTEKLGGPTFTISGGATVRNGQLLPQGIGAIIGGSFTDSTATGTGVATITGNNSQWIQTGGVNHIGVRGTGQMNVFESGYVSNVHAALATFAGSIGDATISGVGSAWAVSDDLSVGGQMGSVGGTGTVVANNQGLLSVGRELKLWPSGSLDVAATGKVTVGTVAMAVSGTVMIGPGGVVSGAGSIVGSVVNDGGSVSPGSSQGILHVTGTATLQGSSRLQSEIGGIAAGTQYDRLEVSGAATLGGNLEVSLANGFVPATGQSFDILTANSITGTFANLALPALPGGQTLHATYGAQFVRLTVGPITTYNDWKSTRFTLAEQANPLLSGPAADPDGDGLVNELEYFFASEPKSPAATAALAPAVVIEANQRFLTLTFSRAQGLTDAPFGIERTSNLANSNGWSAAPFQIVSTTPGAGVDILTVKVLSPLGTSADEFFRLRVN